MSLSSEDVRDILHLLDGLPFDELHLETERFRLSLRRTGNGEWTQATDAALVEASAEEPRDEASEELSDVRAPLIGTFYRAPGPGAAPFVEVGSVVGDDTVVGIIETMKLMNPVPAGVRGTVVEICRDDAELVEQDAVLMRVAPKAPDAHG